MTRMLAAKYCVMRVGVVIRYTSDPRRLKGTRVCVFGDKVLAEVEELPDAWLIMAATSGGRVGRPSDCGEARAVMPGLELRGCNHWPGG